ncbi:unnamed protein product [Vitrella brassicaformis CCMP3155]|uniref:Uncharacterized protein n=1 Tax=Vitrella brassicaformis (strain CCMP3155) TaxID=1169540 RepID=A0A0G4GJH4_VITBC|nr:unnamed protein product [Vitrella brassicaformis CCMP3155]|eukprot:CEM30074.1 unnamed protein product [Vitrella brassicaformis CCMP3155]
MAAEPLRLALVSTIHTIAAEASRQTGAPRQPHEEPFVDEAHCQAMDEVETEMPIDQQEGGDQEQRQERDQEEEDEEEVEDFLEQMLEGDDQPAPPPAAAPAPNRQQTSVRPPAPTSKPVKLSAASREAVTNRAATFLAAYTTATKLRGSQAPDVVSLNRRVSKRQRTHTPAEAFHQQQQAIPDDHIVSVNRARAAPEQQQQQQQQEGGGNPMVDQVHGADEEMAGRRHADGGGGGTEMRAAAGSGGFDGWCVCEWCEECEDLLSLATLRM